MIEIVGDIWDQKCDWLCITTNGMTKKNNRAVMGAGIALQARQRYTNIDLILGKKIKERGNVVSSLVKDGDTVIIAFPTKNDWRNPSDMDLIVQSAQQLKKHFDNNTSKPLVMIPRPGCSNGGLEWEDVKEKIGKILVDDRFIIVDRKK